MTLTIIALIGKHTFKEVDEETGNQTNTAKILLLNIEGEQEDIKKIYVYQIGYNGDTEKCIRNDWHHDKEKDLRYWFNDAGMMITNTWYKYKQAWHYMNADGSMCKSQLVENSGKIYAVDAEGRVITEPVNLVPDQDGALQYPGLVK